MAEQLQKISPVMVEAIRREVQDQLPDTPGRGVSSARFVQMLEERLKKVYVDHFTKS